MLRNKMSSSTIHHNFTGYDDLPDGAWLLWCRDAKAMDSDDDVTLALAVVAANDTTGRSRRRRKTWSKPWLLRRPQHGAYETLLKELSCEDDGGGVRNFLRMETPQFEDLCRKVGPCIDRVNTNMRRCISSTERVAITLRILASGKYI